MRNSTPKKNTRKKRFVFTIPSNKNYKITHPVSPLRSVRRPHGQQRRRRRRRRLRVHKTRVAGVVRTGAVVVVVLVRAPVVQDGAPLNHRSKRSAAAGPRVSCLVASTDTARGILGARARGEEAVDVGATAATGVRRRGELGKLALREEGMVVVADT